MKNKKSMIHPYIPNSVPKIKAKMLQEIGIEDIEELYEDIPDDLRFKGKMDLPEALLSEYDLKRHVERILAKCRCWLLYFDIGRKSIISLIYGSIM